MSKTPKPCKISCPKHGLLENNRRMTAVHIGNDVIRNVECEFCSQCDVFYTISLSVLMGDPEQIDGKSVWIGRGLKRFGKSRIRQYKAKALPVDKKPITQKKDTHELPILSYHFIKGEDLANRIDQHNENLPIASYYLVTNQLQNKSYRVCPECNSLLSDKRYNVPVYNQTGDFVSYYVATLMFCRRCARPYMTERTFLELKRKLQRSTKGEYITPDNMRIRQEDYSKQYIYDPVYDNGVYTNQEKDDVINHTSHYIEDLNPESFLKKEGYSVDRLRSTRREILQMAVKKFGKRKVVDHLLFLIRTRKALNDNTGDDKFETNSP